MKKNLCKPCYVELKTERDIVLLSAGVDKKITCAVCGRRRFGATYDVKRKVKKA